ncbi:tyrosine-protein phosphatase [Amycolatopsis sp. FBCC-B4732]|uniref:tyrosine-protein phosphatase n=1 Tax=Amycolatopsis sp. FBCC-B4732 TaxID=3079339 RepID=UPI001FF4C03E|nr:tyrosine-protein phosphatase [Amycolatopsis sp. FBCC-B4732]UOX87625.1 tyrosine-protein phosphatase [Amycolatopsis sp. FBCC-B4732]
MRILELDGAWNVRDLGGLPTESGGRTREGLVWRGDALHRLSSKDRDLLFGELGIRLVIDLRTQEEQLIHPPVDIPGVQTVNFSILPEGKIGREPFPVAFPSDLARVYVKNLTEGTAAVARTFEAIADEVAAGAGALFHCAAGRDRTGITAAILLDAVDVDRREIAADYVASNHHLSQVSKRLAENPIYHNDTHTAEDVPPLQAAAIESFLELVDMELGGSVNFLQSAGVPVEAIRKFTADFVLPAG